MIDIEAQQLAHELMAQHLTIHWTFKFDRACRRFGQCNRNKQTISLSLPFTRLNPEAIVKNTILHEIAHALTLGGHNNEWRNMHIFIGGNGERCYSDKVVRPTYTRRKAKQWVGTCPNCEHEVYRYKRTDIACRACCRQWNGGRYSIDFKYDFKLPI